MLNFENNIEFSTDYIAVLEIENKKLFSSFTSLLICDDFEKQQKEFILIENDKELKISKNFLITTDILGFDINNKKIQSLAVDKLEKICQNDEVVLHEIKQANTDLYLKIVCLINELNCDFCISDEWSLPKYLKAFNFQADTSSIENSFDKIILYLQIVSELFKDCVVCFINLKSYFDDEQIEEIYKFAIYNNVQLFIIESALSNRQIKYEKKLIIDNEFDEFQK